MAKIIKAYAVHGDSGNDHSIGPIIAYFTSQHNADLYAVGKGWYGGNGCVTEASLLDDNGTYYALTNEIPIDLDLKQQDLDKQIKERALNKLTLDEKRVLGIK